METQKLKDLKELLNSFINSYSAEYPISSENAESLKGSLKEILEDRWLQELVEPGEIDPNE